jgi:tetratricopeptide (TPR) repeat protein
MHLIGLEVSNEILGGGDAHTEIMVKAQQALLNPTKLDNQQLIETWATIGLCYSCMQNSQLTEEFYLKALEIIRNLGDEKFLGKGYADLGFALYNCLDYSKAITYYEQSLVIFERFNEVEEIYTVLSQLAFSCQYLGQRRKERYYLKCGVDHPTIAPVMKAIFLERLALSLDASGVHQEAISIYEEALSIFAAEEFYRAWEDRVQGLAKLYGKVGDMASAERTLKRLEGPTVEELLARLDDNAGHIRASVIANLVNKSKKIKFDVRPILHRVIAQDPSEQVRKLAIIYLKQLDDDPSEESLSDSDDVMME